ncbi:hypothetical protein LO763_17605 [Glycomyces sp. A-F 0318]|uniref:hypothetical protein n=1 Tax=Glycomyces amatae TaxID=2881355 RepID=UPI001E4C5DB3|nr:hypothetical protein [Glycomyces amatae]MCD0445431.1 hypothetical protein [Glycomyces amatae]
MIESPPRPRPAAESDSPAYLRLVRSSAWYDLAVTIGFATPWTYALLHGAANAASGALGLSPLHEANPTQLLYANLMGSVVTVWALLRLVRPQRVHGLFDGAARLLFSAWFAYALAHGGPELLWALLALEVPWGVAQLAPWCSRRFRRSRRTRPIAVPL